MQKGESVLLVSWFGASITGFLFALFLFIYLSFTGISLPTSSSYQLYQALPPSISEAQEGITSSDGRIKAIEEFFNSYKSVLSTEANTFINVADKYNLDWRLLPAISMQESIGARKMIQSSYNPFGYGIYGSKILKF